MAKNFRPYSISDVSNNKLGVVLFGFALCLCLIGCSKPEDSFKKKVMSDADDIGSYNTNTFVFNGSALEILVREADELGIDVFQQLVDNRENEKYSKGLLLISLWQRDERLLECFDNKIITYTDEELYILDGWTRISIPESPDESDDIKYRRKIRKKLGLSYDW